MRLLVLGLNWIASPQSLIDTWMPQFIMISNEKIIHWGYPIANSICNVKAALSTLWFPWGLRGHSGMQWQRYIQESTDTELCIPSRVYNYRSTFTPCVSSCLPFHLESDVAYRLCAIKPHTKNKLQPYKPNLSTHLPGSEVRGLKWM